LLVADEFELEAWIARSTKLHEPGRAIEQLQEITAR
jgi:hypothetical protein